MARSLLAGVGPGIGRTAELMQEVKDVSLSIRISRIDSWRKHALRKRLPLKNIRHQIRLPKSVEFGPDPGAKIFSTSRNNSDGPVAEVQTLSELVRAALEQDVLVCFEDCN